MRGRVRSGIATVLGRSVGVFDRGLQSLGDARRAAAFLAGRLAFAPRADDVYIVTYPRSGTTWMQFMLHLLVTGDDRGFRHITEVSPWFERSLAVGASTASDFASLPSPRVFKSHLPWGWLPRGRYIYIVRQPADVLVSYWQFYRSHLGCRDSLDEFFARFVGGRVQYGSYFRHVACWTAHADRPELKILRYEQLRADPATELQAIATFLGIACTPERIAEVVERASLAQMKAMEDRFDHITAVLLERGMTPAGFIREGHVGRGLQELSPDVRKALAALARHHHPPRRVFDLRPFLH